jgi:hypothetical protein
VHGILGLRGGRFRDATDHYGAGDNSTHMIAGRAAVGPAVQRQKPLGSVLGFGCEDVWAQQIIESDPSQQLGAHPI